MEKTPLHVLIVDDDPTMATLLRGLLRGLDGFACQTVHAPTAAAAREELRAGDHELVLLDYNLPDEDGLVVLAAVGRMPEERRPLVIMLTGSGNEQVAVDAMKLGARDYLVKGAVNLPSLRRAIIAAFAHRRIELQLAETNELVRRHNAQLEADLALAREVQQALLPQQHPRFAAHAGPDAPAFDLCHRWQPSHKVAGDYFAVIPLSAARFGVFQCDVMGHGMRAALVTALVHGLLRECSAQAGDPAAFLGAINVQLQALLARAGDLIFATASYLVADAATGEVVLANAGHPWPLHLRRAAALVETMTIPGGAGTALGLLPDSTYQVNRLRLEPGDGLLLYTDGLYEAPDATGEEFGRERLQAAVQAHLAQTATPLLDGLLADVASFRGLPADTPLPDDVCVVALDYSGALVPSVRD